MKVKVFPCLLLALAATQPGLPLLAAGDSPHWTYEGEHGPDHWGDLSPGFIQCKVGVNQSPIDITNTIEADLPPLTLDYTGKTIDLVNNGHTAQVNVEPGSFLRVEGQEFELLQFHVHVPSEHRINGKSFPLEVHYVHRNQSGQLAVIGVLHEQGEDHPKMARYIDQVPKKINAPVPFDVALQDLPLVSIEDKSYFRYNGSLTTPPCSEGVRWYVLKSHRVVSKERTAIFNALIGDDARGPQPVNARPVLR
jgi:carbonic anhydrase